MQHKGKYLDDNKNNKYQKETKKGERSIATEVVAKEQNKQRRKQQRKHANKSIHENKEETGCWELGHNTNPPGRLECLPPLDNDW